MKTMVTFVEGMDATPIKVWNKVRKQHSLIEIGRLTNDFDFALTAIIHRLTAAPDFSAGLMPAPVEIESMKFTFSFEYMGTARRLVVFHDGRTIDRIE